MGSEMCIRDRNTRAIPLTEARIRKQERRFAEQLAKLDVSSQPQLKTQDLAVCVIEVNE